MSYCPYCGRALSDDMSFCPGCGAAITAEEKTYMLANEKVTVNNGDYKIYLTGIGSASKADIIDLLEDVLGYTTTSARNLVSNIPVQIAGNLSLKQAAVVAQAFEEYGAELSVTNKDKLADISKSTSSVSLFNSDGSFLSSVAMILATIGASNRLRRIVRPKQPSLMQVLFHSLFNTRRRPPVHVRRRISRPYSVSVPMYGTPNRRVYVRQKVVPTNLFGMPVYNQTKGPRKNGPQGGPLMGPGPKPKKKR